MPWHQGGQAPGKPMVRRPRDTRVRRSGRGRGGGPATSNLKWYALIVLVVLTIAGIGAAFLQIRKSAALDEATLCPESGPKEVLVVLLDLSDPLSPVQRNRLESELVRRFEETPDGTMISVGIVESDLNSSGIRFGLCRPSAGGEANPLYQNRQLIEQRYRSEFLEPLENALEAMFEGEVQGTSPLMEAIHQVVVDTEGFRDREIGKTLIVVSDLYQNSDTFSFYRGEEWSDFRNSQQFLLKSRFLEGFDVTVIRVPRNIPRNSSNAAVEDFWVNYFETSGIERLRMDTITLGGL